MDFKDLGNKYFHQNKFQEAIQSYSKGIQQQSDNYLLYSNRSIVYYTLNKWNQSKIDARKCLQINKEFEKAYCILCKCCLQLKQYDQAVNTCNIALTIFPYSQKIKTLLKQSQQKKNAFTRQNYIDLIFQKLLQNQQTAPFMLDQSFLTKLQMLIEKPSLYHELIRLDKRIQKAWNTIMQTNQNQ